MKSLDQHTTSDPKHTHTHYWEQIQTLKTRELLGEKNHTKQVKHARIKVQTIQKLYSFRFSCHSFSSRRNIQVTDIVVFLQHQLVPDKIKL